MKRVYLLFFEAIKFFELIFRALFKIGNIWRGAVAVCDWRTHLRRIRGKSILDVVFISNMRDEVDLKRFAPADPRAKHFNGPRYWFKGISARVRALTCTAADLNDPKKREEAKEKFISAVRWAEKRGAKVVLLAAGTKRLFGEKADELKALFPDILFTIGDNGTLHILWTETLRALLRSGLIKKKDSRICVLGPYGFLGERVIEELCEVRRKWRGGLYIVGAGPNAARLTEIAEKYKIDTAGSFSEIGKVDAVVACTHSDAVRLNPDNVELLRIEGKKLLVADVAEPSNFKRREYEKCKARVLRQDAGNAYSPDLHYVLGPVSYRMFRCSKGVLFGCFAEALALYSAIRRGCAKEVYSKDWFEVNKENREFVFELFRKEGFDLPTPRCFGKIIKEFNLDL